MRNVTLAIGLLIFYQLRQSKALQRIPDKADIIETVDSILNHLGWFAFHELLVLHPLIADPHTKPNRNIVNQSLSTCRE
jgi:hypothetical protein